MRWSVLNCIGNVSCTSWINLLSWLGCTDTQKGCAPAAAAWRMRTHWGFIAAPSKPWGHSGHCAVSLCSLISPLQHLLLLLNHIGSSRPPAGLADKWHCCIFSYRCIGRDEHHQEESQGPVYIHPSFEMHWIAKENTGKETRTTSPPHGGCLTA